MPSWFRLRRSPYSSGFWGRRVGRPYLPTLALVLLSSLLPQVGRAQAALPADSTGAAAAQASGNSGHYLAQTLVGAGAGWGAGLLLGYGASGSIGEQGGEDPGLEGFIIGFPVGFLIGTGLGVSLTARAQGEPNSFPAAALGGLAGGVIVIGLVPALQDAIPLLVVLALAVPATSAVMANHHLGRSGQITVSPRSNGRTGVGLKFRF
jgi:hypothetical protein